MAVLSLPLANSEYGYAFYFESRSANDMTLNYTSWLDNVELVRNIILWSLLLISLLQFKKNTSFKVMILGALILFLNPLVSPFIATYITNLVYCRAFEIIANPFVLVFLVCELLQETKPQWFMAICVSAASAFDGYAAYYTLKNEMTGTMITRNQEGYHWETKVTEDQWDMYTYIYKNISSDQNEKHSILTSDPAMKAYIPNIQMVLSTLDVRSNTNDPNFNPDDEKGRQLVYFNPLGVMPEDTFKGYAADYTKLSEVIRESGAEYVVMRTPFAVWDEKGFYIEAYQYAVRDGVCEVVYENGTWILLKVIQ